MSVKISNLPAATSVNPSDIVPIVQSGSTKKAAASLLRTTDASQLITGTVDVARLPVASTVSSGVVQLGTASGTACEGNDIRLVNSRTPTGSAGGDLNGSYPNPTIDAIQGQDVDVTTNPPTAGQALAWDNVNAKWKPTTISGGGGGAGTVTSVNVTGGNTGLTTVGGPITTSGTIQIDGVVNVTHGGTGATTAAAARIALGTNDAANITTGTLDIAQGGTGSATAAAARSALGTNDAANISTGTLSTARGGTGVSTYTDGQLLIGSTSGNTLIPATITAGTNITVTNGNGTITIAASGGGSGTVTTSGTPTTGNLAKFSGSTAITNGDLTGDVTTSGSLVTTVGRINGVGLGTLATGILKNTTSTGVPSIAVAADFPTLNQNTTGTAANVTGTVAVANGGTGVATLTGIAKGNGTGAFTAAIAADFPTLNQNTTGTAANVTGTVAIANGGTGQTAKAAAFNALSPITTTGDLIIGSGTNTASVLPIGTNGQVLTSNGTTATWSAPAASGVSSFSAGTTGFTPSTATTGAVTLAGTLNIANGGTGAASASAAFAALSVAGAQAQAGLTVSTLIERNTASATAITGVTAVPIGTSPAVFYTSNATGNFTLNITGVSTYLTANGYTSTITVAVPAGTTAFNLSALQIDGTTAGITLLWQNGAAAIPPAAASSTNIYSFTILRTAASTYTVFANLSYFRA